MFIAYGGGKEVKGQGGGRELHSTRRSLSWKKAKLETPWSQNVAAEFTIVNER